MAVEENKVTLGDRITYEEQMSVALRDRIDKENQNKLKINREKLFNRKKGVQYRVGLIIAAVLLGLVIVLLAPYYSGDKDPNLFDATAVVALSVLAPFVIIAFCFCLYKYIYYSRRKNKELDTRDFKWRTYSEMLEISEMNVMTLIEEESKMVASLTLDRQKLDELVKNDLRLESENDMGKYISADEMNCLPKPAEEELAEANPLAMSLFASASDIEISVLNEETKSFFYSLMAEYLPDTNQETAAYYQSKFGNVYLVAKHKGRPVGICYGWPRSEDVLEEPEFTIQGIAITERSQALGIGSVLLKEFEKRVAEYKFDKIGVGSAPGYVEHFYIKNGYIPVCYKYPDGFGDMKLQYISNDTEYRSITRRKGGFVVFEKHCT